MHTNSSYPTPRNELNLNLIPFYKQRYNCVIGYSGHEPDLEPTVIAVSLGAQVIERHITLSHDMWGTDQKASLDAKMSYTDEHLKKSQDEYRALVKTPSSGGQKAYEKRQKRLEELKQTLGAGRHQRKYPHIVGKQSDNL